MTGASRGLGWAMARGLAIAGAHVILNGRDVDALKSRANELSGTGLACSIAAFDVGDPTAVRQGVKEAVNQASRLDGLIANAGYTFRKPVMDMTDQEWRHVVATDLDSGFVLAQCAAEAMLRSGGGAIAFVSSILGLIGRAQVAAYCASKAGLIGLTHSLAAELGPRGIRCNAIAPGYFVTDGTRAVHENPEFNSMICKRTPLARWGEPAELAGIAVFLMSSASSYVNGAVIPVDGGVTAVL
ncbi:MAG: SDR family oxidoreductase [Variovorax sp.]